MRSLTLIGLLAAGLLSISSAHAQELALTAQQKYDALAAKGIFAGQGDAAAGLDQDMTRAQFARVAALLLGLDGVASPSAPASTFSDAGSGTWAIVETQYNAAAGVMTGNSDNTFQPSDNITLEQLAVVMAQALGLEPDPGATVDGTVSTWAQGYVAAAVNAGLLPASQDYTQAAQREELATSFYGATAGQPVRSPVAPPDSQLIADLKGSVNGIIQGFIQAPGDQSEAPTQLALADNNAGNSIALDEQMQQAVDRQMSNPLMGTYSGGFDGSYFDGAATQQIVGALSFTGDFSGSPTMFSGSADIIVGGSGTISLHDIGFLPGTRDFTNSGSSGAATIGLYTVTDMTVTGGFTGSTAKGGWSMTLQDSGGGSPGFIPDGDFTVSHQ